jgi:choline dehydrogenase
MYGGPQQPDFVNTIVSLTGISHFKDLNGGTPNCVSITPLVCSFHFFHLSLGPPLLNSSQTLNWHDQDHRSSSVQAYLTPVQSQRTKWTTLTNYIVRLDLLSLFETIRQLMHLPQVTKINWATTSVPMKAAGVQFAPSARSSTRYTAFASREVIIAAGAIQVPICFIAYAIRVLIFFFTPQVPSSPPTFWDR